ncbi:hypothetical protein IU450_23540 [Nocardia abscessus]|uniref:hypothetical protein n=1 Tax=Nocardia abscessus TaxID=120957 RepID=UPI0018957367|nr:hypothetical protein [Nocardia abscessus]MBF6338844.1 hypothetical protein [Nocardia abscessus]
MSTAARRTAVSGLRPRSYRYHPLRHCANPVQTALIAIRMKKSVTAEAKGLAGQLAGRPRARDEFMPIAEIGY